MLLKQCPESTKSTVFNVLRALKTLYIIPLWNVIKRKNIFFKKNIENQMSCDE